MSSDAGATGGGGAIDGMGTLGARGGRARRPWSVRVLVGLLVFQGVGAVGGGGVMVADPSGRAMGWDTGLLSDTPFSSFLWPGVVLGVGLGISSLVLAFGVLRRPPLRPLHFLERWTQHHWSWSGSIGLGIGLLSWIILQIALIGFQSFLQPLMFVVGACLVGTPLLPAVQRHLGIWGPGAASGPPRVGRPSSARRSLSRSRGS